MARAAAAAGLLVLVTVLAGCSGGPGPADAGGLPEGGLGGGPMDAAVLDSREQRGPLTRIWVGRDLGCQVERTGDSFYQFFPPRAAPADCGTFLLVAGTLYAPDFEGHSGTATSRLRDHTPFTPINQTAVTGDGLVASPFQVVTTVAVGDTGVRIVETDSYVPGDDFYSTSVEVRNEGSAGYGSVSMFRAGDCYLGDSDVGYGFTEVAVPDSIGCSKNPNNEPSGRIEEWLPDTPPSSHYEAAYHDVWAAIGRNGTLPGTCDCTRAHDNGAALVWDFPLPSGAVVTQGHRLRFSPFAVTGPSRRPPDVDPVQPPCQALDFEAPGKAVLPRSHAYDLPGVGHNWTVRDGAVDLYLPGDVDFPADFRNATTLAFVDLAATLETAGTLTTNITFPAGTSSLSFTMAGNHRREGRDSVEVVFGGLVWQVDLDWDAPWGVQEFPFNNTLAGPERRDISFHWLGSGREGPVLSSILVCTQPLPNR